MNSKIYTVSQVNSYIRYLLESDEYLSDIHIIGEVSNLYLPQRKGRHIYFTLKDDTSRIKCIIFSNFLSSLEFLPQNGMKVVVEGRIGVYEKMGEYSIYVSRIYPQGRGELDKAFEALKEKLKEEGLFREERKRKIPSFPKRIGIITSIDGAAVKDIIKNALNKFPNLSFLIFPVHVQGAKAAFEIVRAFEIIKQEGFDLDFVVLARGGGSLEELWPFNEEIVARAIYSSPLPVVSAVGHERDVTIADLVSDLRVSTPSMVAETTIPSRDELFMRVLSTVKFMRAIISGNISKREEFLRHLLRLPFFTRPKEEIIKKRREPLERVIRSIVLSEKKLYNNKKDKLNNLMKRLASLNPLSILERGYTVTYRYPDNIPVKSVKELAGDRIKTLFHDGEIISKIEGKGVLYE